MSSQDMQSLCKSGMLSLLHLEDAFTMKFGFCVIWYALSSQQCTCCQLMNCFLEGRGQMDGILTRQESYYYCILPMSLSTLVDSIWTLRARRNGLISGKKLLKMHSLFLRYLLLWPSPQHAHISIGHGIVADCLHTIGVKKGIVPPPAWRLARLHVSATDRHWYLNAAKGSWVT
jgi:hypothetical protein